jgi:hypothetical protein
MDLRKVAAFFETTEFDAYDESDNSWDACFLLGKVMPIESEVSNSNRNTRRALLGTDPLAVFPVSNTLRVLTSGDIYIVGDLRKDYQNSAAYDQSGLLHRSSTVGTINRRAPAGPSTDPGWLVETLISTHYMDIELRAVKEAGEQEQQFDKQYLIIMPLHAAPQQWDRINVGSYDHIVEAGYVDSGFKLARVANRLDPRKDFTYYSRGDTASFNPSNGVVTSGLTPYNVTGFALDAKSGQVANTAAKSGTFTLVVDKTHIGVVPTSKDEVIWESQRSKVIEVEEDFIDFQYKIHCSL